MLLLACLLAGPAIGADEPTSDDVALDYYLDLATRGHPYAQLTLGDIHRDGELVPADPIEAYAWYAVAAEQGIQPALNPMQDLYAQMDPAQRAEAERLAADYVRRYAPTVGNGQ